MSAYDTFKAGVLGNPYDANKKPSRALTVQGFKELQDQVDGIETSSALGYPLYDTSALGIAGTSNGEGFSVLTTNSDYLVIFLNNNGTADEKGRIPLSLAVEEIEENAIKRNLFEGIVDVALTVSSENNWNGSFPSIFSNVDYSTGVGIHIAANVSVENTGSVTLTIGSLVATIREIDGSTLSGGELKPGRYLMRFGGSPGNYGWYLLAGFNLGEYQENITKTNLNEQKNKFGSVIQPTVSGSNNVWTGVLPSAFSDFVSNYNGQLFVIKAPETNTGAVTIDFDGTERDIVSYSGNSLESGDLVSGAWYLTRLGGSAPRKLYLLSPTFKEVSDIEEITTSNSEEIAKTKTLKQFLQYDDQKELFEIDADGNVFNDVDEYGNFDFKSKFTGLKSFNQADDDFENFEVDENGNVLNQTDDEGVSSSPMNRLKPIPYVSNDQLLAGEKGELVGHLRGDTVLNSLPFSKKSVRALTNRNGLYSNTSLSGVLGGGVLIPDNSKILHIILLNGQSLSCGAQSGDSLFTTWFEYPDDALMFDGDETIDIRMGLPTLSGELETLVPSNLTGFQPLMAKTGQGNGNRGETIAEGISRHMVNTARSMEIQHRTMWIAPGLGGTAYSGLAQGTIPYANMLSAVQRAKDLAETEGWEVVVDCQLIVHGEGDASNSNYYDNLITWQSDSNTDLKAITGQQSDIPFLMSQPSSFYGSTSGTEAVQAFLKAHELSSNHFLMGPNYNVADLYSSDVLHFTGPGYRILGETFGKCVEQVLWGDGNWDCVRIKTASRNGNVVSLVYNVPNGPLVLDTTQVNERNDKGFEYFNNGSQIAISNVTITDAGNDGEGVIELTLGSTPSGVDEFVHYAFDGHSGDRSVSSVPRGNVRDSAGENRTSLYEKRRLDNWGVHQKKEVVVS